MNQTFLDLLGITIAFFACIKIFVMPGWLLGRFTGIFQWAERTVSARLAIASILSISAWPVAIYLVAKLLGFPITVFVHNSGLIVCAVLAVAYVKDEKIRNGLWCRLKGEQQHFGSLYAFTALCLLIVGFLIVDWQSGNQVFNSQVIYDHFKNVAIADSIQRSGVPPVNPFFQPGYTQSLCYYYFWPLLCASVFAHHQPIFADTRLVVSACCLWTTAAFIALIFLVRRELYPVSAIEESTRVDIGIALLLAVGGLDIIPVIKWTTQLSESTQRFLLIPATGVAAWWSQQITDWLGVMCWVPQHLSGLVACICASLLLRRVLRTTKKSYPELIVAGLCFATAIGFSPYQTVVYIAFWGIIALYQAVKRELNASIKICLCGVLAALFATPFLLELRSSYHAASTPLGIGLPFFRIFDQPIRPEHAGALVLARFCIAFLPLLIPVTIYWRRKLQNNEDTALLLLAILSGGISTLIHSQVDNDDFAWRSILSCQFVLLLWCGLFFYRKPKLGTIWTVASILLIGIGVCTTFWDAILMRDTIAVDYPLYPQRAAQIKYIYSALDQLTAPNTTIQPNPLISDFFGNEPFCGLYGHRSSALGDSHHAILFGTPKNVYATARKDISRLFTSDMSLADARQLCTRYGIGCVLLSNVDPAFRSANTWTATLKPIVQTAKFKAYTVTDSPTGPVR